MRSAIRQSSPLSSSSFLWFECENFADSHVTVNNNNNNGYNNRDNVCIIITVATKQYLPSSLSLTHTHTLYLSHSLSLSHTLYLSLSLLFDRNNRAGFFLVSLPKLDVFFYLFAFNKTSLEIAAIKLYGKIVWYNPSVKS